MTTSAIRTALERLVELHNADGAWGLHWDDAMGAARTALDAEPAGEGPSEEEIDAFIHQWWELYGKGYLPNSSDNALITAALARWARPAAPAAPEPGSATALATWLRKHSGQCVELGRPDWAHMADRSADTLEAFSRAEAEK